MVKLKEYDNLKISEIHMYILVKLHLKINEISGKFPSKIFLHEELQCTAIDLDHHISTNKQS